MDEKKSVSILLKWILVCCITFGLLTSCANAMDSGGDEQPTSEVPDDIDKTVVIDNDEEVVRSPGDDESFTNGGGGFDWDPKPEDKNLETGVVLVNATDILTMESYPPQFAIIVSGALPTPCHELRVEVNEPDQENNIHVKIYSVNNPSEMCVQVLESFDTNVPLGTPPPGSYQIILNGEDIGEIGYE